MSPLRVRIRQRRAIVATRHCFSTTTTTNNSNSNTQLFFEWLEQNYGARFGGTPLPMDSNSNSNSNSNTEKTNNQMITTDQLTHQHLNQLFRHEISVLKVKQFFPKQQSIALGRQLSQQLSTAKNWKVSTSRGLESSDVVTIGKHVPYNIAKTTQAEDEYFETVRAELKDRRQNNANANTNEYTYMLHPLDLLRLELDELWPSGAGLARKNYETTHKDCMGGGLPRLMVGPTRWKKGLVHVDELAPLTETHGCFSANVYLQLPYKSDENDTNTSDETDEQPVMEVWPLGIRSKWDWYRNATTLSHLASQDPEGQVILRKALGDDHKIQVSAAPGDLVLLCVQRPHCAIGFGHQPTDRQLQTRVSLQCFLQYSGENKRLTIDS